MRATHPTPLTAIRETVITLYGVTRTIRTTQGRGGVAALERAHTRAVIAALEEIHTAKIDREHADHMQHLRSQAWPDSEGFPGSGELNRRRVIEHAEKLHAERRIRRFRLPRNAWTEARRPWTPPKPTAVIPASVRDLHEHVEPEAA